MSASIRRRITWIAALAVLAMALAPAISQWLLVQRNAGLAWVAVCSNTGTRWVAVKVQPVAPLARPVPLAAIKAEPRLAACAMLKYNRLSVAPLTDAEWAVFMELGGGTI